MDFISVSELVESVAKHVPIPEAWKDGVLKRAEIPITPFIDRSGRAHVLESNHQIKVDMLNGLFLSAFRDSEAAAALDQYLHNAAAQGPRWFDWGETGRPKLSDAARNEAMPMLVHMSRYFDRYIKAYQLGRFDSWPNANDIQSSEGKFKNTGDAKRLREIGFERTELILLLDRHEIPHALGPASTDFEEAHPAPGSTGDSTLALRPGRSIDERQSNPASYSSTAPKAGEPSSGRKMHPPAGRQAILADEIKQAQEAAGADRYNARVVWAILFKMAEEKRTPLLLGVTKSDVRYMTAHGGQEYTFRALQAYITRRRPKETPPQ